MADVTGTRSPARQKRGPPPRCCPRPTARRWPGCSAPTRPSRPAARSGWPSAPRTCSGSRDAQRAAPGLDVSAFGHVLQVDPETRTAVVGGMTTYEDLADATLRLRPDAAGRPAAQDDHARRRGDRPGHRVHLAAQRPAARVRDWRWRSSPATAGWSRPRRRRARRALPRLPQLLRHARLRALAHHRARAGPAVRAPAPLPLRRPGGLHGRRSREIAADGSYRGHRADFVDGTAFSPDEMYLTVGAFSEVAPWRSDYTRERIYYQSIRGPAGGLPHHPRLPVAVGHRLVLVLAAVRRAEPAGPPGLAAPVPPLGHLPQAGRLRPQARPVRGAERPPRPAAREDVIQDVEIPVERGAEFLRFFADRGRHEPGVAVPAAAARRARPGRCTRCGPARST